MIRTTWAKAKIGNIFIWETKYYGKVVGEIFRIEKNRLKGIIIRKNRVFPKNDIINLAMPDHNIEIFEKENLSTKRNDKIKCKNKTEITISIWKKR